MRIIYFSLLVCIGSKIFALDTLQLQAGFQQASITKHARYIKGESDWTTQQIISLWENEPKRFSVLNRANLGYLDKVVWVLVPLRIEASTKNLLIEIQNPQLDHIDAYQIIGNQIIPLGQRTGDEHPFKTRNIAHRNFLWHLKGGMDAETQSILFRIEKINSSLVLPITLWEENSFIENDTKLLIFYGICFGIMLIVSIYSLGLGIVLKQRIQFQYVALVLTGLFYFLVSEGLAYQFVYPGVTGINSFMRLVVLGASAITFILFSISFLSLKKYFPAITKLLYALVGLLIVMALLIPLIGNFYLKHGAFFIPFLLAITLLSSILPWILALLTYKSQKDTTIFYLLAHSAIFITSLLVRLEDIGLLEHFTVNPIYFGAFTENMIFFIALGYRTKKVYDQRNEFSLKISRHQKEIIQSYVRGTEQERQRVARNLHDDIGSRMSHLKRQIEIQNHDSLLNEIEILCTDIRNLSHQLAPQSIRFNSLTQMIQQVSFNLHHAGIEVTFQQYDFPDALPEPIKAELFRVVQEATHNIVKHSGAKHVDIQLFKHENQLVITIEDDGCGFDTHYTQAGIGLNNMQVRMESLDGTFEVSSTLGVGTSIMLTVPFN